jgi:pyrroloquinoline quinone (PQQ) biosynthesis protein C
VGRAHHDYELESRRTLHYVRGMNSAQAFTVAAAGGIDLVATMDAIVAEAVADLSADPVTGSIFDGTASRDLYLRFLIETYHYVLETTPLLKQGARALAGSRDALGKEMHERFEEHAQGEAGHERWVLDDIAAIGGDVEAAKRAEPSAAVQAYVAMVRFVGLSRRPLGLIGVAYFLEGISEQLGTRTAENMKKHSKIPNIAKALSFVESHGSTDVGHMEEGRATLRKIESARDKAAILLCAQSAAFQYAEMLHTAAKSAS